LTSPHVVLKCRFLYALNNPDRFNKFSKKTAENNINAMFNYFSNVKKKAINMFDYFNGTINQDGKVNLLIENGEYANEDEINKRKKEYLKYFKDSNLWQGIISFNNDFINESIELKELEKLMTTKVIPDFLRYCGFKDIDKMSYQLALHTNTEHYHFHFSFIEKEANYIGSKNKLMYRRSGQLTKNEMNYLKTRTLHLIQCHKEFTPLVIETNKSIEQLKKYFKPKEKNFILKNSQDLILESNILELGKLLDEKRAGKKTKIKYNSINDVEIKKLTKAIKVYLFKNENSSIYKSEKAFSNSLTKINQYFYKLNEDNNIKVRNSISDYSKTKSDYIENYIYNAIVNHAAFKYTNLKKDKKYIKDSDIIQEAILKMYRKNQKQNKFEILLNYLSNIDPKKQFKNKFKIEQSIKNINAEMEDATVEFQKLFQNEYSYRKEGSI